MSSDRKSEQHLHTYFLANISHEFRTPLASLNASIELLLNEAGYLSPAEMGELLNSIQLSASGLQTLVDNLLESTSIEAGHFTIRRRPTELNRVLAEAIRIMQPLLDRREQSIVLTEPLKVPTLHADPVRLTQVFINLIANASKFSPLKQRIDLGIDLVGSNVSIAIADRGPGIPPGERDNIFKRFIRLETADSERYGMGLGLSVSKAIIEGHGGTINVEDRPGGGSIFWITLPLEKQNDTK
jgi:K+-sensing histidine kinase KdpD